MLKHEKAVAIAKDVLKQIKAKKIKTTAFDYVVSGYEDCWAENTYEGNAQKHINEITSTCHVCALGACMLSYIRKFDGVDMSDITRLGEEINIDRDYIVSKLKTAFSLRQLDLIELAFQYEDDIFDDMPKDEREALEFVEGVYDETERLTLIMKNIIKNKGVFKPCVKS